MRLLISIFLGLLITTISRAADFSLTSSSFRSHDIIPKLYTCDGDNISPQLRWSNPPPKTQSFILVLSCPDAAGGTFYNWIVYNIPGHLDSLVEGASENLPIGSMTGQTSIGDSIYRGPCPPDALPHHYEFTLYALDAVLNIPENITFAEIKVEIKRHAIGQAKFSGTFQHQ